MKNTLVRVGTRGSRLARRQAAEVIRRLAHLRPHWRFRLVVVHTAGDRDPSHPPHSVAERGEAVGLFTKALSRAVIKGRVDIAVHSLKDLPTGSAPDLVWEVITPRADAREVLVSRAGQALSALPRGAAVGTGSRRRAAFLRHLRPDLTILPLRGNVETRLHRLQHPIGGGEVLEGVVLALAGLVRLGLADRASEVFAVDQFVPAAGQGALAVEFRPDRTDLATLITEAREETTSLAVRLERRVLHTLKGGCRTPVGVFARPLEGENWEVIAAVATPDGAGFIKVRRTGLVRSTTDAERLADLVADDLRRRGADSLISIARSLHPATSPRPPTGETTPE